MIRRIVPVGFAFALVLAVIACDQLTAPANLDPYGFLVMNARGKGAGVYTTAPTAIFYKANQVQLSSAAAAWDSCRVFPYDPTVTPSTGGTYLSAGTSLGLTISGHSDALKPASASTAGPYNLTSASGLVFNPGDTLSLVIPGDKNGFPAVTVLAKTAEPFTMDPIETPAAGKGLLLKWSSPSDNNSALLVTLRYSNSGGSTPNEEIYCSYVDNGGDSVPSQLMFKYILSPYKEVLAQRLRTQILNPAGTKATFNVISTFDRPLPASP